LKSAINGVLSSKNPEQLTAWLQKQVYIPLGFLLQTAAMLGLDAGPMEGFDPKAFDEILELAEHNLSSCVIVSIGYRSATDATANAKKGKTTKRKSSNHEVIIYAQRSFYFIFNHIHTMYTKRILIEGITREFEILKHLGSKVTKKNAEFRLSEEQRSIEELEHYIVTSFPAQVSLMVEGIRNLDSYMENTVRLLLNSLGKDLSLNSIKLSEP
jgi:hypothetical protein